MKKRSWCVAPLAFALALGVSGCSYAGAVEDAVGQVTSDAQKQEAQKQPVVEAPEPLGTITAENLSNYGKVVASDKPLSRGSGSYDRLSIVPNSGYSVEPYADMEESDWTNEDFRAGLDLTLKYVVEEVLDSEALEGDSGSYKKWHSEVAKKYFAPEVHQEPGVKTGEAQVILGSASSPMPALIHDGSPRQESVDIKLSGYGPYDGEGVHGIQYGINFTAEYRVGNEDAAEFATQHLEEEMTREEYLGSETSGNAEDGGAR